MDEDKSKQFLKSGKSLALTLAVLFALGVMATSCARENYDDDNDVDIDIHGYGGYHSSYYYGGTSKRTSGWKSLFHSSSSGSHYTGGSSFSS